MTPQFPRLLGDVGGTNARFAWQASPDAAISHMAVLPGQNFPTLLDAIRHYLHEQQLPAPVECCIGIANPIHGDIVRMTNHTWAFSISEMRQHLGLHRLLVINDFTALALSLPSLPETDRIQIGGTLPKPGGAIALLGAGTGLGVSGLVHSLDGHWTPLQGEGGHVTLAACDEREAAVIAQLKTRFDHVSAERVLSGSGLINLYVSLCALDGITPQPERSAADISGCAVAAGSVLERPDDAHTRLSIEAMDLFCRFLGTTAGNLALTLGAVGGVYIGGGIAPRLGEVFTTSRFRERFRGKGRFISYLDPIPVYLITAAASPALLGAAQALES